MICDCTIKDVDLIIIGHWTQLVDGTLAYQIEGRRPDLDIGALCFLTEKQLLEDLTNPVVYATHQIAHRLLTHDPATPAMGP